MEKEKLQLLKEIELLKKKLKNISDEERKKIVQQAIDRKQQRLKQLVEEANEEEERGDAIIEDGAPVPHR